MGKAPCCSKVGLHKGPWSSKEDALLTDYIQTNGEGQWRSLPKKAGLLRCGKSCRLRWMNYLRPGIKRGNISTDEEDLIIRLHSLLGNRWSLIAGRLPGRTDNEIKNYWNTHLIKRLKIAGIEPKRNKSAPKKPPKEPKRKISKVGPEIEKGNPKKKQKIKNSSTPVHVPAPAPANEAKIKIYVPKPIRVSPGFSSNNTINSPLSSSGSHEEVNNKETDVLINEMSDFDWPLIELGDDNYGRLQVCEDDQVFIHGCDFSLDQMPTISNMLEQVYDEYLQCL